MLKKVMHMKDFSVRKLEIFFLELGQKGMCDI